MNMILKKWSFPCCLLENTKNNLLSFQEFTYFRNLYTLEFFCK